jgi:hypothetical protein
VVLKRTHYAMLAATVLALFPLASLAGPPDESDGDGIPDVLDKCTHDSRNGTPPGTCDSDSDGYGNVCDADFDQNFIVSSPDFSSWFIPAFKGSDPSPWPQGMDMDCNGAVTSVDFSNYFIPKFKGALGGAIPGPSGLACAGTVPCN